MPTASSLGLNSHSARPRATTFALTVDDEPVKQTIAARVVGLTTNVTRSVWKPSDMDDVTGVVDKPLPVRIFAPILNLFFVTSFLQVLYQPQGWAPSPPRQVLYATAIASLLPVALSYRVGKVLYDFRGALAAGIVASAVIASTRAPSSISTSVAFSLVAVPAVKLVDTLYERGLAYVNAEGRMPMATAFVSDAVFLLLMLLASLIAFESAAPVVDWSLTAMKDAAASLLSAWKPLSAMIVEPAKVLLIDAEVEAELLRQNEQLLSGHPGAGAGLLLAVLIAGSKMERAPAVLAMLLLLFGGSTLAYVPFFFMHPLSLVGLVAGGAVGSIVFDSSDAALKQPLTTRSLMDLADATSDGDGGKVVAGVLVAAAVSFLVSYAALIGRRRLADMLTSRP